jgi:hypothetical protein
VQSLAHLCGGALTSHQASNGLRVGLETGASAKLRMVMSAVRSKTRLRAPIWAENLLAGSWRNNQLVTSVADTPRTPPVPLAVPHCSPHTPHLSTSPNNTSGGCKPHREELCLAHLCAGVSPIIGRCGWMDVFHRAHKAKHRSPSTVRGKGRRQEPRRIHISRFDQVCVT